MAVSNERLQQNRFSQMSDTIIGRVDEMSSRIDDLEKSIQDLMVQASCFDWLTESLADGRANKLWRRAGALAAADE